MNFKKSIVSLFAALIVIAAPAISASAKGLPNKNSNYWNQARSVKTTRAVTAYEHSVSNNTLSNTTLKKMTVKKGTPLTVSRIKNKHKEWILNGIKSNKNAVWITTQNTTSWMKSYTDPAYSTRYVTTTKKIKIQGHKVVNKLIQSKVSKTVTIKKGTNLFARKLNNDSGWVISGNVPQLDGAWVYNSSKSNWMKLAKIYKTNFTTVDSNQLPDSGYVTAYYSYYLSPYTISGTTIYPGDQIQVQKANGNSQSILLNGVANYMNLPSDQGLATLSNTSIVNLKDKDGKDSGVRRVLARYTPDDSKNTVLKGYSPKDYDQWAVVRSDHKTYNLYIYYSNFNGWVFNGVWNPNQTSNSK